MLNQDIALDFSYTVFGAILRKNLPTFLKINMPGVLPYYCTKLGPAICYSMLTAGVACLNGPHPVSLLLAPPSLSPLASARLVRAQVLGNYLLVAFPQHCPCPSAVFIQLQASLQRNAVMPMRFGSCNVDFLCAGRTYSIDASVKLKCTVPFSFSTNDLSGCIRDFVVSASDLAAVCFCSVGAFCACDGLL